VKTTVDHRAIIARRLQLQRREFFARMIVATADLRAIFDRFNIVVGQTIDDKAENRRNIKRINEILHSEVVTMRGSIRGWLSKCIRDSARLGFKHIGDALLPIFKHNRESIESEMLTERVLFEAKLVFGMDKTFAANAAPTVVLSSKKWGDALGRIIKNITKKNLAGLNPSDRVFDLTQRAEQDMKRMIANGMAAGENPAIIASKIKKYVSPSVIDASKFGTEFGAGVYRSPFKNAMRLARTEMNRTYAQAAVNFTANKPWVTSVNINLSRVHADADECDDLAEGGPYTPQEAGQLIPAHPHCMCYITPNIDPKYLGDEEE
jgi:hypothetical protein